MDIVETQEAITLHKELLVTKNADVRKKIVFQRKEHTVSLFNGKYSAQNICIQVALYNRQFVLIYLGIYMYYIQYMLLSSKYQTTVVTSAHV